MGPFFALNIAILFAATLGNCLALQGAILGEIMFSGYRYFLISLLVSDLYVVAVNVALFALQAASFYGIDLSQCAVVVVRRLAITGFVANLLNFSAMSADHFIGLVCPLRYRQLMKDSTIITVVIGIWTVSLVAAFADYPVRAAMLSVGSTTTVAPMTSISSYSSASFSIENLLQQTMMTYSQRAPNLRLTSSSSVSTSATSGSSVGFYDKPTSLKRTTNKMAKLRTKQQSNNSSTIKSQNKPRKLNGFFPTTARPQFYLGGSGNNVSKLSENLIDQLFPEDKTSWCDGYFDQQYNIWLECVALVLAVSAMTFLTLICAIIFRGNALSNDIAKRKLRKLIVTTLILLCSFCFCWLPYVGYEISLVLISQTDGDYMPESQTDYVLHNVLYSIFMFSQVTVPVAYIARNRAVRRHLRKQYGCCCDSMTSQRISVSNMTTMRSTSFAGVCNNADNRNLNGHNFDTAEISTRIEQQPLRLSSLPGDTINKPLLSSEI